MIDDLADATWDCELDDLCLRIGHRFGRTDLRRRMRDYVRALLGPVGSKNAWQLAEYAGHCAPGGLQKRRGPLAPSPHDRRCQASSGASVISWSMRPIPAGDLTCCDFCTTST
ncbi:hypothetical protein [Streptomyces sp. NPDC048496]|uniref:hypothetical protein n=1 Tax=Streptomyces sp. NPDC048496 TaxID=3365558 RepID=UPI0037110ADB